MGSSLMLRLHWHPSALKISYKENYVMMSKIGCLQSTPSCNFWPFLVINESQIRRQRVAPGVKLHKQWEGKRRNRKLRLSEGTRAHNRLTSQDFVFFFFSFLFFFIEPDNWQGRGLLGGRVLVREEAGEGLSEAADGLGLGLVVGHISS